MTTVEQTSDSGQEEKESSTSNDDAPAAAEEELKYDRWTLADAATIDYGYFSKSANDDEVSATFYLTTAINYTNGPAHMGHAYEAATSDAIARFERLQGSKKVFFLTGADEHGQKIAQTAASLGQTPMDICNKVRFGICCICLDFT